MRPTLLDGLVSLLTAALIALAGWVYHVGNQVSALEAEHRAIGETIQEIHQDVREVRAYLLPHP